MRWSRALTSDEIAELAENPYAMLTSTTGNDPIPDRFASTLHLEAFTDGPPNALVNAPDGWQTDWVKNEAPTPGEQIRMRIIDAGSPDWQVELFDEETGAVVTLEQAEKLGIMFEYPPPERFRC
jgi:hypothetical protein